MKCCDCRYRNYDSLCGDFFCLKNGSYYACALDLIWGACEFFKKARWYHKIYLGM